MYQRLVEIKDECLTFGNLKGGVNFDLLIATWSLKIFRMRFFAAFYGWSRCNFGLRAPKYIQII